MNPYYQDEWVTIYHLTSLPICDKLSLDKCMEVDSCRRKQPEGIEQGSEGKMCQGEARVQRRDTNKLRHIFKSVSGLVLTIMRGGVMILSSSLAGLGPCGDTKHGHVNCAEVLNQRDTTRMITPPITVPLMSSFYAEDVICLRMVG